MTTLKNKTTEIYSNPVKNKYFNKRGYGDLITNETFKDDQILNGKKYHQLEEIGIKGVKTLEDFIKVFNMNSILNINIEEWFPMVRPHSSLVKWKSSSISSHYKEKDKMKCIFCYEDDDIRLEFSNVNDDTIELLFLNVNNRFKGLGTKIMKNILDTCDELGIVLKVLPVNYDIPSNFKIKPNEYLNWLREWYKSFELVTIDKTPNLYYIPISIEEYINENKFDHVNELLKLIVNKNISF